MPAKIEAHETNLSDIFCDAFEFVVPPASHGGPVWRTKKTVIKKIHANRDLLKGFSVQSPALFDSVVRGDAGPHSDVDILVEFAPDARIGLFALARLQRWSKLKSSICRLTW
jgi:predicted nucleotidyltransferase